MALCHGIDIDTSGPTSHVSFNSDIIDMRSIVVQTSLQAGRWQGVRAWFVWAWQACCK